MSEFIEVFCSSVILASVTIHIWNKLLKENIKIFSLKTLILIFLSAIVISINYLFNNPYLRITSITIFLSLIIKIIYRKSFTKSFCVALFGQVIVTVADLLFTLIIISSLNGNINEFKKLYFSKIYSNVIIALFSILLVNFSKIIYYLKNVINILEKLNKKHIILLLLSLLLSFNLLLGLIYYQINSMFIILIISVLLFIYTFITLQSITQQRHIVNIRVEYDQLMDKSVDYEQVLDENKRDLHELKNDFSVLHVLIEKSKEEALEQLDFMVKEYGKVEKVLNGTDKFYYKTLKIPSGGLRGLLSTKLKLMEELNIKYNLRVGRGINSKMLEKTNSVYVRQVGKLLGIYLDNAIAAVKNLENKNINIEVFNDDKYFNILVSNNFGGVLELDKVGTMGYTTKGNGHGYGLSLAKEILKNNKYIKVNTKITGNVLIKIISLKI